MKKEIIRDYATEALICYYKLGCPSEDEHREKIRAEIARRFSLHEPEYIYKREEREIYLNRALLADIAAAHKTMQMLRGELPMDGFDLDHARKRGAEIADAVQAVYFGLHREKQRSRRIIGRVVAYSVDHGVSERTVYNYLKLARRLFAYNRGLSFDFD